MRQGYPRTRCHSRAVLEASLFAPWTVQLARPITLVDGTTLVTFKDALESLIRNFAGTDPTAIEPVIALLVKAEVSRKQDDVDRASEQFEAALRGRQLIK